MIADRTASKLGYTGGSSAFAGTRGLLAGRGAAAVVERLLPLVSSGGALKGSEVVLTPGAAASSLILPCWLLAGDGSNDRLLRPFGCSIASARAAYQILDAGEP